MKSWSIFAHSFGMVFRNLKQAMQIGLVPVVIAFAGVFAALSYLGVSVSVLQDEQALGLLISQGWMVFVGLWVFVMVMMFWIVTSWHRFVLLEEYPQGWVPPFRFDRILSYIGHAIMLGILLLIAMIPAAIVMMGLSSVSPMLASVFAVILMFAAVVGLYRLLPVLPAAAIGKPLKIKESWEVTAGETWTIVGLLFIGFLFQFLLNIMAALFVLVPIIGPIFVYAVLLVMSLVNVSILTTLYGHYIEGRPI
ncbi:threonine dehydratase [Pseudophaeobacter sp. EL27]|uniref:threonine dehydratase n=1 Tax=Pseudophaeobacter sp. EL27 TaxID=2107580 RepID=UPI000EFD7307|nr:threonine dehydratase [Pseudophaeobacter sp. EL27]